MMRRSIVDRLLASLGQVHKGQEKLWIVFLLWGWAFYLSCIAIGHIAYLTWNPVFKWLSEKNPDFWVSIYFVLLNGISILGFMLVFAYPVWFFFALLGNSKNTSRRWCKYGARIYAFLFLFIVHVPIAGGILRISNAMWEADNWNKLFYPEYGKIAHYSALQAEQFKQRLLLKMQKSSTIFIHDLVDFDWDTVCAMGGYSHLREDMALKNIYGKDIAELELFPNVRESSTNFVFLKRDNLVAVINHTYEMPDIQYTFKNCAGLKQAKLKLIYPNAHVPFEVSKSKGYRTNWKDLAPYHGCIGIECKLTFHGD